MIINNSYLLNFRNFDNLSIRFCDNINIIIGNNGEGKTNILEAIYFSAKGKSFRLGKEMDLIKFDKINSYIRTDIESDGVSEKIEVKISRDKKKQIRLNDDLVDTMKELRTFFDIVTFIPDDLKIIKDNKIYRRNFIDEVITGILPAYNNLIIKYNNILNQRNYLLKTGKNKRFFKEQIVAITTQLAKEGSTIIKLRSKYIIYLNNICNIIHKEITNNTEDLSIAYDLEYIKNNLDNLEENLFKFTMKNLEKDIESGYTTIGCHRDDIKFLVNGMDSKYYSSQGQQRTIVLSLKIGQLKLYNNLKEIKPIILLDDVFSELDSFRIEYLLKIINNYQSIISTTNFEFKDKLMNGNYRTFILKNKSIKIIDNYQGKDTMDGSK